MSEFDEFDEIDWKKRAISASRENYYEQQRKLHTVWYLNYAPGIDSRDDKQRELTGPQIQLTFDMGYRLAMKQVAQYIDKFGYSLQGQSAEKALKKIVNFSDERIEDSFCLNYFHEQHEELVKNKQEYESNIAYRDWIDCREYE
jgi:hypothetical protein